MRWIPDILRRFRIPASGPTEYYQYYLNFNLAVGVATQRVRAQRTPASLVMFQADTTNLGVIAVGGQNTIITNGIQLAAGIAVIFTADSSALDMQRMLAGQLGAGVMGTTIPGLAERSIDDLGAVFRPDSPRVVLDLSQFTVVATLANQNLRVCYTQLMRIT